MNAHIELDVADVVQAIREYVQARVENVEVTGVTVLSRNTPLMVIDGEMLLEPVRHRVQPDRIKLPREKKFHY